MPETGNSSRLFIYKCALVPAQFFEPSSARAMLVETAVIDDADEVSYVGVPYYDAVLIYAHRAGEDFLPEMYHLLRLSEKIEGHNRIAASYDGDRLYLVVVQDREMKLCNSFRAPDFTTAEYFLFMALKKFQINPEVSDIYFRTPLTEDQRLSLFQYFRSVEQV